MRNSGTAAEQTAWQSGFERIQAVTERVHDKIRAEIRRDEKGEFHSTCSPELTCLGKRLEHVEFTEAAYALLHEHASPSLKQAFGDSCDQVKLRSQLRHAFRDSPAKCVMNIQTWGQLAATINQPERLPEFQLRTLGSAVRMSYILRDDIATYRDILPETAGEPDEIDRLFAEYEQDLLPELEDAIRRAADELGMSGTELESLHLAEREQILEGREHVAPLPAKTIRQPLRYI